jgi:hypothetical protein
VARIDAPRLSHLSTHFFNDIVFDTQQVIQFISRTPALKAFKKAHVAFGDAIAGAKFSPLAFGSLDVRISSSESDWQVLSLEQVCTSCSPFLSTLEDLYIYEAQNRPPVLQESIENSLWLELLHPFPAVKNLYLSKEFAPRIRPALQELAEGRTTEVLPTLQNIFLEELEPSGPIQEGIGQFVAARQVTNHPVTVSRWEDSEKDKVLVP